MIARMNQVVIEKADHLSDTIYKYQKGKHVRAEPAIRPLRSPRQFKESKREEILGGWDDGLKQHKVNIKYKTESGLFQRMIAATKPVTFDFRNAFQLARELNE